MQHSAVKIVAKPCVLSFVPSDAVDDVEDMKIGRPVLCAVTSAPKGSKALVLSAQTETVISFCVVCCGSV